MELKVLNINVWHGLYARTWWTVERLEPADAKEKRTLALIEGIRALAPDVVTFQECFPQPAFGKRVAQALGFEHVSQVSNAGVRIFGAGYPLGVDTGEGSTILARPGLGLRSLGRRALSGVGFTSPQISLQLIDKRMALAVEVTIGKKAVAIVTCHVRYEWSRPEELTQAWTALRDLKAVDGDVPPDLAKAVQSNLARRDGELDVLAKWIEQLRERGTPVVLAGDMNLDDEAPQLVSFVNRLGFTSVLQAKGVTGRTWDPARNPNIAPSAALTHPDGQARDPGSLVVAYHDRLAQRPDHVYVGPELEGGIVDARIVLDAPIDGVYPSDHFGILATLRVPDE